MRGTLLDAGGVIARVAWAARIFVAGVIGLVVGCGTLGVEGPGPVPVGSEEEAEATCTDSSTLPLLDLGAAVGFKLGAGGYLMATDREDRAIDADVAVALGGLGAMGFGWSAHRSYERVEACRMVVEQAVVEARRTRAAQDGGGMPSNREGERR